jgi:hypothetical protein
MGYPVAGAVGCGYGGGMGAAAFRSCIAYPPRSQK